MSNSSGFFISIEGVEGAGKTTALGVIEDFLKSKYLDYVLTREPGGTPLSEKIRDCLLQGDQVDDFMLPETELMLMFAARSQNIGHVVKPALKQGKIVISDRFTDASYAYQGGGRGLDFSLIQRLEQQIAHGLLPNLTFLLDTPIDVAMARLADRQLDRIEQESKDFFQRIRMAYLDRAKQFSKRFVVIDATQSLDIVKKDICLVLLERLGGLNG